jgi:hypothetical protein
MPPGDPGDRTDNYAIQRAKLRASTKQTAMARLWEMAREALATRSRMGVKTLTYESDLVPGIRRVTIQAELHRVVIACEGVDFGKEPGGERDAVENVRYVLDEAWLLGVAT